MFTKINIFLLVSHLLAFAENSDFLDKLYLTHPKKIVIDGDNLDLSIQKDDQCKGIKIIANDMSKNHKFSIEENNGLIKLKAKKPGQKEGRAQITIYVNEPLSLDLNAGACRLMAHGGLLNLKAEIGAGDLVISGINGDAYLNIGLGKIDLSYKQIQEKVAKIKITAGSVSGNISFPKTSLISWNENKTTFLSKPNSEFKNDKENQNFMIDLSIGCGKLNFIKN